MLLKELMFFVVPVKKLNVYCLCLISAQFILFTTVMIFIMYLHTMDCTNETVFLSSNVSHHYHAMIVRIITILMTI